MFLAIAEELHFGRAAKNLHMAQPPLSRRIIEFEREVGAPLFDRTTRSVTLTAAGAALVEPAREVLESVRRAEQTVRSASRGELGTVRVSFAGVSTHPMVARLARVVRSRRPGLYLELSSQNYAQPAMMRVLRGETDLAFGRWDVIPSDIETRIVVRDRLALALPDANPLSGESRVSARRLAEEVFISLPSHEGAVLSDRLRRLGQMGGFVPEVVQVVPDTQTALALVSAGVGCHLTVESVVENVSDPHVVFVSLSEEVPNVDLRVAWRRSDRSPALRAVLDAVMLLTEDAPAIED
jgi:DNA-binding transcriptional LysR family regulator